MTSGVLTAVAAVVAVIVTMQQMKADVESTRSEQIANRYTAAVNQIGDDSADVRLGGVYALQGIMQDSPRHQPAIVDVLSAYVRTHARSSGNESAGYEGRPEADVHSAFEILARRDPHDDGRSVVDLRQAYLPHVALRSSAGPGSRDSGADRPNLINANLSGANLESAELTGADLRGSRLGGAKFPSARFDGADLRLAQSFRVDLSGASLERAKMSGGSFVEASLSGASLRSADLHRTDLRGADLKGADLKAVDLRGADLRDAKQRKVNGKPVGRETGRSTRVTVQQLMTARLDARTKLPRELAEDPKIKKWIAKSYESAS